MLTGRKWRIVRVSVIATVAVALGGLAVPGASADPDPSIDDVQRRVDDLHHEAEQAAERFNTIRAQMGDARDELAAIRKDVRSQSHETEQLRGQVEQLVLAQVDGTGIDTTGQLLLSEDPDEFISSMVTLQSYSDQTADMLVSYENSRSELDLREQQAEEQLAKISDAKAQMAKEKAEIDDKAAAAEDLLSDLEAEAAAEAEAEAEEPSRGGETTTPPVTDTPVSGRAGVAVETALAQVGDPYVYGAAGPDSFDCSGLTMYAWAAAGVSLPHSSSIQSGMGVPVSMSDLAPGDLVFYYSPVSHVGMYIGNGQIVHAPNPSTPVQVVPVGMMPITTIRRVG